MVAKISSGKSVFGVLAYNKIKVDDNTAGVLYSQKIFDSIDGKFSIRDCMDSFYPYLAMNSRTKNVVFHASINPDPKDRLPDEQLSILCREYMEKMGYGGQPYIVVKHSDIDRTHAHIISLRIDENGRKIPDTFENRRSMAICRELELRHKLHIPTKKEQREDQAPTMKIDYKAGDLKHQVGNITKSIIANYNFQSLGEYRTLLEMFNVTVEEVKGEYKEKPYRGLVYSVLDENGEKVSKPFKSSLFGKSVNMEALQKHFEKSKIAIDTTDIKDRLKQKVSESMKHNRSMDDFKQSLLQSGIGCVFRQNEQGRIYGATFIDYQNRTILNGSRLGKEFSANVFNDLFQDSPTRNMEPTAEKQIFQQTDRSNRFTESSGVQPPVGDDSFNVGVGLFEQHGTDYENESFVRQKEQEEKLRLVKKKRRGRSM
ncbi:conjugal transfer protein MobB [Dysgonomonas sp. 521]|uniref:conjugal transfer protein MobB n=1 Tax=Dysgonomonas sp. 521 TaxID=2302932 RepID=UPI0013D55ABC|nr:conjugal transfer protein MobB [Dysgonomonas sp. 521]